MGLGVVAAVAVPVIAYLLTQSKSGAAASGAVKSPTSKPPAQRMAEVIATGDPAAIRFEAGRLRQEGYPSEAAELERVAGLITSEHGPAPTVVTPTPMPTPVAVPPVTPTGPNAPVLSGVPANLQGVTLRETKPIAYDPRTVTLQQRLIELGWPLTADGKFGPATTAAVKEFQKLNSVTPVDGIVGPITLIRLADPNAKRKQSVAAPTVKPAAAAPKPAAPKPAPLPTIATLPAGPAPSSAGKAPTITAALKSLPSLLKNGKATGYKAPASSGQAVKDWQQVLKDLGFASATPDGKFGDATEAATRAFQTAANTAAAKSGKPKLSVDGIVGPATVARAAEARIMPSGPATFAGSWFGDDVMYAPSSPQPDSPLPGIIPDMAPVAPDPRRALAARLTHMLLSAPRDREDRTLVTLYQAQEGLRPTGFYGPATALSLARTYGIVPPKPLHWTESRTGKSKANYRDALRMLGERDPQRVEEWQRAGAV
jgi:peptidoglycan hydrolase-like protein with peptidoglycan-binding domain